MTKCLAKNGPYEILISFEKGIDFSICLGVYISNNILMLPKICLEQVTNTTHIVL